MKKNIILIVSLLLITLYSTPLMMGEMVTELPNVMKVNQFVVGDSFMYIVNIRLLLLICREKS